MGIDEFKKLGSAKPDDETPEQHQNVDVTGNNNKINITQSTHTNNSETKINWAKWGAIFTGIAIGVAIIFGVMQYYQTSSSSQIPETSPIKTTMINQKIIDCETLPNGNVGLSYYNKTLGFSVTAPNINWSISEDDGYFVSHVGFIEHEKFMGGIMISQQHSPVLLISVFDDSDQKYIPIDKFFGEIAGQINKKIELKYVSIVSDPDKESGKFEAEGPYNDKNFYVFGRALRTDDKIYLIHYPNFNPKTTKIISEEIDQIYNSINIFPACKI